MSQLTKEQASEMHQALDEIMKCSDALYKLLNHESDARLAMKARGFHPCHTLNNAVSRIRGRLQLAGFPTP